MTENPEEILNEEHRILLPSSLAIQDPFSAVLQIERRLQGARINDSLSEIRIWTAILRGIVASPDTPFKEQKFSNLKAAVFRKAQVALSLQRRRLELANSVLLNLDFDEAQKIVAILSTIRVCYI